MKHYAYSFLILIASIVLGFCVSTRQSHQLANSSPIAVNEIESSRAPASIKTNNDFSALQGDTLVQAIKRRLIAETRVVSEKADRGIMFGDFTLMGLGGQKDFACKQYPKIKMSFVGDGTASSGELPKMEVEGPCTVSADINMIAPVWIPVSQIINQPVAEGYFNFNEGDQVKKVSFLNLSSQWPHKWYLKSVELTGENKNIVVDSNDLREHEPIAIEFTK